MIKGMDLETGGYLELSGWAQSQVLKNVAWIFKMSWKKEDKFKAKGDSTRHRWL